MSRHDRHFANCICVDCENERPAPPVDRASLAQVAREMRALRADAATRLVAGDPIIMALDKWASAIEAAIGAKP